MEISFEGTELQMIEHPLDKEHHYDYEWKPNGNNAKFSCPLTKITDIHLVFDCGIVEVFANNGTICGTRRYIHSTECHSISLLGSLFERSIQYYAL